MAKYPPPPLPRPVLCPTKSRAPAWGRVTADPLNYPHGDRDEFFPVAIPVAMYGAIAKAALWIVPGGDHSPSAGADKEEFVEVVSEFLEKP